MIAALTLLLVFQLIGEVIARALALPIPGPVIGMALLFLTLLVRGGPGEDLRQTAGTLLQHLSLLFVPAGTGIVLYGDRLANEWLPLLVALVASTALAIIVTAVVLQALTRRRASSKGAQQ
ncbi:MAG: CidA/LrgA family protein [Proteobacteria bacterium]|nr:CidA/LrgA family protein [Pseudomonadota bacterium]